MPPYVPSGDPECFKVSAVAHSLGQLSTTGYINHMLAHLRGVRHPEDDHMIAFDPLSMAIKSCLFQPDFTPLAETASLKQLIDDCWNGKLQAVEDSAPALLDSFKLHGIRDPILTALLIVAITQKFFPLVSYLLSLTSETRSLLAPYSSPICSAAQSNPQPQIWALLLDNGLASAMHRGLGNPASLLAGSVLPQKDNQIELFDVLFAHGLHISDQLFNNAASSVDEDTMRYLVTKCQPKYMDATAALIRAAAENARVVRILVDAGMDVNYHHMPAPSFDNHMWPSSTPLHSAASSGNIDAVKVLLEKGADTAIRDSWRQTPEEAARKDGHMEAADIIRGWGVGGGSENN